MLKKFFTLLVVIWMIFSVSLAREDIIKMPSIEIVQSKILYADNNYIMGMMRVKNTTDAYFPKVYYSLGLSSYIKTAEIDSHYKKAILGKSDAIEFSIGGNEEKDIYFSYDVPKYLPEYVDELLVTFSTRTMSLTNGDIPLKIGINIGLPEKGFLVPNYSSQFAVWEIDDKIIGADIGPNITSKTKPLVKMFLNSTFDEDITVIPNIKIYQRSDIYNSNPVLTTKGKEIKFKAKEEKMVEIQIPVASNPDSYLVRIEFVNSAGDVVSYIHDFRYVVEGVNAKIVGEYIVKNENELKLNIFVAGPADSKNKLTDAILEVKATDGFGTVLYNEKITANLANILKRKIVSLEKYGEIVDIEIKLEKDNVIYDEVNFKVNLNNLKGVSFTDITDSATREAVGILNAIGMINGYPDGTFRPNNNITRAEFTVIATRLAGLEITNSKPSAFSDVVEEHWAKDYINLAQENGCVSGYSDGTFKPNNNVTIAESITILINVLDYRKKAISTELSWPLNYLSVAQEFKINEGVTYNSYMEPASRGNVSIMTENALFHKLSKGGI